MFTFLFCLVAALTLVLTKNVYVTENGFSAGPVEERIAGGEEAHLSNMFDYQVQMIIDDMIFCSGAILNERYILTAAHCVQDVRDPNDVKVRARSDTLGQGMMIRIAEIHLHPQYDYPSNNYDIAYMRTQAPMDLTGPMRHLILPERHELPEEITIAGWGIDGENGDKLSKKIKYVKLSVINSLECQVNYPEMIITKNMFCAQVTGDFSKGACKGDGGGPATETQTRKLVGISSFSRGCGPGMGPSGFTRVDSREILEFIKNGTRIYEIPEEDIDFDKNPETEYNDDVSNGENSASENIVKDDSDTLAPLDDVGNNEDGTHDTIGDDEVDNNKSGTNEGSGTSGTHYQELKAK